MSRPILLFKFALIGALMLLCNGCATREFNSYSPSEAEILQNPIQLTRGFDKAGEAYFSNDMSWIIFQACPPGEPRYQMYVAPLRWSETDTVEPPQGYYATTPLPRQRIRVRESITGIGRPIRISPQNSRNTCGFFSPDGNSLIFASTADKEDPTEPTGGYQRSGRDYRWSYPPGMEIFRADGWQAAIAAAEPNAIVDLAQHPLTRNTGYDAECAFSPDGKWIIFCSNRGSETGPEAPGTQSTTPTTMPAGDLDLYVMRADGGHVVRLTKTPGYDGGPFFSPDGKRIVYRSDRSNNNLLQIYVADLAFDASGNITGITNERALTHDQNVNWAPFWHPDGKHIIYTTSLNGHENYELYMMRDDGSQKTRITDTPAALVEAKKGADVLPVFSPDHRYLMWTCRRSDNGTPQVFLARFKIPKGA
jgi:Tol biopolymer transport system component